MNVLRAIKHFQDEQGKELDDVVEVGKSIETNNGMFREGVNVRVTNEDGDVYEGILAKVSTLAPSAPKELSVQDTNGVKHLIKYADIKEDGGLVLLEEDEDESE